MFIAPTTFKVEQSVTINSSKEIIKENIVSLEKAGHWSPWADIDPEIKEWFEGEDGQVGSKHFWDGNDEVGAGSQEIISIEDDRIEVKLTFVRPFESEADCYFLLDENEDGSTNVTWGFTSKMPRPFNIMMLFMDMTDEIEKDYSKGLENLKRICEDIAANSNDNDWEIKVVDYDEKTFLTHREEVAFSEMEAFFSQHLGALYSLITENEKATINGHASSIYYDWDKENQKADVAAALPYTSENELNTDYKNITLSGKAYKLEYYGNYEGLGEAHGALHQYLEDQNLPISKVVLEEYVTDPGNEPDLEKWLTNIYYFE